MATHHKIEEIIESLQGASCPEANPYLLTKLYARINVTQSNGVLNKLVSAFQKPVVSISFVLAIILINICFIFFSATTNDNMTINPAANNQAAFSLNVTSMYDIENTDQ